jgi:hypothetical protein
MQEKLAEALKEKAKVSRMLSGSPSSADGGQRSIAPVPRAVHAEGAQRM